MLNAIFMMNDFPRFKIASNNLFHYEPMLANIKIWFCGKGVVPSQDHNITPAVADPSSSPSVAFFPKLENGAMARVRTIFHMLCASGKKILTFRAFSLVVDLTPRFSICKFVPNPWPCVSPFGEGFYKLNPVHGGSIISGFRDFYTKGEY